MENKEHDPAEHIQNVPHSAAVGMRYVSHSDDECVVAISYGDHLIGDPDTGVIHGGAITALRGDVISIHLSKQFAFKPRLTSRDERLGESDRCGGAVRSSEPMTSCRAVTMTATCRATSSRVRVRVRCLYLISKHVEQRVMISSKCSRTCSNCL